MSIVVTGASGHLGPLVVDELLARGVPAGEVVAGARDLTKLAALTGRGVRATVVDYDDPATLKAAFRPGDVVLLISGSEPGRRVAQHAAVVDAASGAGVAHLAYTSAPKADDTPLVLAPEHAATEALVRDSGLPFTILRHNWYTENYVPALEQARATGEFAGSAGDGRVASAARADFAAADAAVLVDAANGSTGSGDHAGRVYELTGDVSWTFDELVAAFAEVLGRDVAYRRLTTAEHVAALKQAGLDEGTAGFVAALDGNIADGALDIVTGDLARLAGRPSTPLAEALRAHA